MMKSRTLLKEMWMLLAILFCSVTSANAATITYSLTTHVDGRTITGTANLQGGASLEDNMPQALWRGYTTYKYYADADLTKEITTAPNENATVYVDYVFDPPFTVSEDGQDAVWHYLKHQPGVNPSRFYYYSQYHGKYDQQYGNDDAFWQKENLTTGNMTLKTKENAQWAFYGDAYCLNLKFNDVNNIESNDFMVCKITSRTSIFGGGTTYTYKIKTGAKMMPGWQLYVNDAINGGFSLGLPEDTHINHLVWLYDHADAGDIHNLANESDCGRSSKNHITNTDSQGQGWDECLCYAFMATPATDSPSSLNPWRVTYKIQKADGSWYDDIVITKNANNLTPTFPPTGFTPQEGYTYEYFYKDANFTEKYAEDYTMPNNENTVLYIIEKIEEVPGVERTFTVGKWMTLVLPDYNLLPRNGIEGRFLDYVAVESKENAEDGYYWQCDLKFEEVGPNDLVPNRPYLYLPTYIEGTDDNVRSKVVKFNLNGTPEVVSHVDQAQPDVTVSMYGTYEDKELVPCQPVEPKGYEYIYFYFGNPAEDVYNFYTVENPVTITPTICYFDIKATKNADPTIGGFGAKFSFFDGTNAINNIEGVKKGNDKVYNLNGQQVQGNLQKGIYIVNGKKVLVK